MKYLFQLMLAMMAVTSSYAHIGDHGENSLGQLIPAASLKYNNEMNVQKTDTHLIITSNGIPAHDVGKFPNSGNLNAISPQQHSYKIPLQPKDSGSLNRKEGKMGVAINGVPMEPGTAETWNGNRAWREEAIVDGNGRLGLDQNNAHVQPTGSYHYHGVPHGLIKDLQKKCGISSNEPLLIGWAADGFPIYYKADVKPSYQLKSGSRPSTDSPGGRYDGTYTADFEYKAGSGDLDEANGMTGPTPGNSTEEYHYYVTESFPFLPRVLRGKADDSFVHPRGGPGMRRGPGGPPPGGRPPRHPNAPPSHLQGT